MLKFWKILFFFVFRGNSGIKNGGYDFEKAAFSCIFYVFYIDFPYKKW